jgi:hypothetical protein
LGVPGELALLEIALYVEPRHAVLEKLRGAINHSHTIMKHIIGGMDATKELIFKAFLCVLDALLKLLESYYCIKVGQMNQGVIFIVPPCDRDGAS